jgi:hypothetical protein
LGFPNTIGRGLWIMSFPFIRSKIDSNKVLGITQSQIRLYKLRFWFFSTVLITPQSLQKSKVSFELAWIIKWNNIATQKMLSSWKINEILQGCLWIMKINYIAGDILILGKWYSNSRNKERIHNVIVKVAILSTSGTENT